MNLFEIPPHSQSPRVVNAVIEIEKGSSMKYEYDGELGVFTFDRSLDSAMVYPASYGSIPSTLADDDDPLDILVITERPIDRGVVVECRVLGILDMDDDGDKDYKVLAVPTTTRKRYRNLNDVDELFLKICRNFFARYKDLDNKVVKVHNWLSKDDAYDIIRQSGKDYEEKK